MKRKIDSMIDIHKHLKVDSLIEAKDLPVEILVHIFKFFTPSERRTLLSVCKKWLRIGSDFFIRDSCITLIKSSDYLKMSSLLSVFGNKDVPDNGRKFCVSIWYDHDEKIRLMNFIELVGTKIKHLKVTKDSDWDHFGLRREFYDWIDDDMNLKLPNLETLEIEAKFLKSFHFPLSLREIKIIGRLHIKKIDSIKAKKHVEKLTCDFVGSPMMEIYLPRYATIFSDELLSVIRDIVSRADTFYLQIGDLNICTAKNLTCADVTGLDISFTGQIINPIINFENLKEFEFQYTFNEQNIEELFGHNDFTHIGVTKLKMKNVSLLEHTNVFELLKCFPNLEHLEVHDDQIDSTGFSKICQKFSKLKSLTLKAGTSNFSVENLFGQDSTTFGLKDLKSLETLSLGGRSIDWTQENDDIIYQWPNLPNLLELRFDFSSFNNLKVKELFKSIPIGSPNVSKFELSMEIYDPYDFCTPLISAWGKNLTEVFVMGDGENYSSANEILIKTILENCMNLMYLSFQNVRGFTWVQEATLFAQLPSLESIEFYINSYDYLERTRKDFELLSRYMKQN